jgi:hypothetical protein
MQIPVPRWGAILFSFIPTLAASGWTLLPILRRGMPRLYVLIASARAYRRLARCTAEDGCATQLSAILPHAPTRTRAALV